MVMAACGYTTPTLPSRIKPPDTNRQTQTYIYFEAEIQNNNWVFGSSGSIFGGNFILCNHIHNTHTTTTNKIKMLPLQSHACRRGVGRRKNTYSPDLKKKRCVGVSGGWVGR